MRGESASASAGACSPRTRSTAMSLRGSKWTASASMPGSSPRSSTRVSFWPATTWALVTTIPSPATQPEPSTPSPQAVPSTFTTLRAAASTCGSPTIPADGACTRTSGPSMRGNGSRFSSAVSSPLVGGRIVFRRWSTYERWTAWRSSPPEPSATAPSTQTIPSPTQAVSAAPRRPSSALPAGVRTRARNRLPTPSKPIASTAPAVSAPIRPKAGAQPESAPSESTSGPTLVPTHAPIAKPDQRERAGHESLGPSEQGQQDHDPQDDPIEPRHLRE